MLNYLLLISQERKKQNSNSVKFKLFTVYQYVTCSHFTFDLALVTNVRQSSLKTATDLRNIHVKVQFIIRHY